MYLRFAVAAAVVCASSASAHHSAAMFDQAQSVSLTGTVKQFQWTNPHCYIQLVAEGRSQEEWSLEMAAPVHLMRLGWKRNSLKPGDRITVTIHPLRDGGKGGEIQTAAMLDGTPIGRNK